MIRTFNLTMNFVKFVFIIVVLTTWSTVALAYFNSLIAVLVLLFLLLCRISPSILKFDNFNPSSNILSKL
jgi:hypothetical protein